jgi:glutamine synthetase
VGTLHLWIALSRDEILAGGRSLLPADAACTAEHRSKPIQTSGGGWAASDRMDCEQSALARAAFGEAVVEFYVRHARIEHQAFSDAVTDWERQRYFEQI